jgi:hypothetical protein
MRYITGNEDQQASSTLPPRYMQYSFQYHYMDSLFLHTVTSMLHSQRFPCSTRLQCQAEVPQTASRQIVSCRCWLGSCCGFAPHGRLLLLTELLLLLQRLAGRSLQSRLQLCNEVLLLLLCTLQNVPLPVGYADHHIAPRYQGPVPELRGTVRCVAWLDEVGRPIHLYGKLHICRCFTCDVNDECFIWRALL